ncbi:MAG: very short patch repair endonuclease [Proteobacteria bacterium]|nr:very short patch repair endonuclease [Pseudomonadota bacterium]
MTDNLTSAQRSYCMSRVKGKNTQLEMRVRSALHRLGLRYRVHVRELPGRPDIVFARSKVIVFIDGDFWHGYKFPLWKNKMAPFWQKKIGNTRQRDLKNHRRLRTRGWRVIRVWQHELERDFGGAIARIATAVKPQSLSNIAFVVRFDR